MHLLIVPTTLRASHPSILNLLNSIEKSFNYCDRSFTVKVAIVQNGRHWDNTVNFRYSFETKILNEPREGLVFARHLCLNLFPEATRFTFLDDDVSVSRFFLSGLASIPSDVLLGTGPVYPTWESIPPTWITEMYESTHHEWPCLPFLTIQDPGDRQRIDPFYVWGANFTVSRSLLESSNGFHPDAFPDQKMVLRGDGETHIATHFRSTFQLDAFYSKELAVSHLIPTVRMSKEYFCRRGIQEGISASYVSIRSGKLIDISDQLTRLIKDLSFKSLLDVTLNSTRNFGLSNMTELDQTCRNIGFAWHQINVLKNPILLDWCRRDSYC